jgi:hypothetical protein
MQWLNLTYCRNNVFLLGICKGLCKIYYDFTNGDVGFHENE